MEDDEDTTKHSHHPTETLVSESIPPPAPEKVVVAAAVTEMQPEAGDTAISEPNGTELATDVATNRVSELIDSLGDWVVVAEAGMRTEVEDTLIVEPNITELTGDVAADKVPELGDSSVLGELASESNCGEMLGTSVGIKPEAGGVEPILGDDIESGLFPGDKGADKVGMLVEVKPEVEEVEHVDKGFGSSGLVPVSDSLEVADSSEIKREGDDTLVSVADLDELRPVDEVEKATFIYEMDGENKVVSGASIDKESVGDLGACKLITGNNDVAMSSEKKSGEEGVLESVLSFDDVAGQNFSTGTEVVMETDLEGGKYGVPKESPIDESEIVSVKSPVADDVAVEGEVPKVDTEMENVKEVGKDVQGDAEVGTTQMEVEDEMENKDSQQLEEAMSEERENPGDTEMETEEKDIDEVAEAEKGVGEGGKRKRGKNSKVLSKALAMKVVEEDVCFICFDGGDLVLCDRRGCPKAYHPSCVNRDDSYFQSKGRWNCGWHQCSICTKSAYYMCYTCTFSLCKVCIKDGVISCVRDNKGFCEACMKTVLLIENSEKRVNEEQQLDFDDKSSWLYLFKDYWLSLKQRLSLSLAEISQAKNPAEVSNVQSAQRELPEEAVDGSNNQGSSPDSQENREASKNKRRKTNKRLKSSAKGIASPSAKKGSPPKRKLKRSSTFGSEITFKPDTTEWASKELLEFVMHMKNGDKSAISQFDVQALLLEYIKTNKLRDPRRKSQIICDARLQNLFGKPRVGHFEMLKLLESHFLSKDDPQIDDNQGTVVDDESNELEGDGTIDTPPKAGKDKRRKTRKKGQNRGRQSNLDDYAAIDMHNIGLIFLRRKLIEDLLEDEERFCDKVVGTFVRIRISASTQKQDMYRLVQVLGTGKATGPYKVGKRTTDLMLEILNLNKKELVQIDTISSQEFTEEECKRLRQSIKCGLMGRLTVGDILDKAEEIQAARVSDWLESEIVRVSHLRDRASEKGRRKELRECVEKLQLLKMPEERRRRLDEVPKIHADPNMDPDLESEEHDSEEEDTKQDSFMKPRGSAFSRRGREPISPRGGNFSTVDSWSSSRQNSGRNHEVTRNVSYTEVSDRNIESVSKGGVPYEGSRNYIEIQQASMEKAMSPIHSANVGQSSLSFARSESFSSPALEIPQPSPPAVVQKPVIKVDESQKMWHYKDPAGKVQGPFSLVQLRKWSKNGYFPTDLKIWNNTETEDDSILLTNALDGNFQKPLSQMGKNSSDAWGSLSVEVPKHSGNKTNDLYNPPSPTPNTTTPVSETPQSASSVMVQTPNLVPLNKNGNQENILPASLLNSARQLMSCFENGSISSPPVGTTTVQPTAVTNETQEWGTQQKVVPNQTVVNDPQATVGADTQNLDPNSLYSMPIQQQQAGYNPWVGAVPPNVQTPSGSFPMPGYVAMPQTVPGQQLPFPTQVPPNVPWAMGMVQPNMGWGMGMVQGNPNMNWVPMVNPGWVASAGNPGAMVQAMPPGGNLNQGWVAPPGNVNQGWGMGTPPGNQNSGKGISGNSGGWGTPPGNSNRMGTEGHRSGNRYSGPRDRGGDGRPYQPKKYDRDGNRICPFFLDGHCRKGSRCDMVHQNPPDKM